MFHIGKKIQIRLKNMIIWFTFLVSTSFGFSYYVYLIESQQPNTQFNSLSDLYWWWIETITGIGSDIDPVSDEARVVGTVVVIAGFVMLGLFISEVSEIIRMIYARREEGNIQVTYGNHIVIFGYTSLTAGVIKLLRNHFGSQVRILLISNEIETNPFPGQAEFLHDNPIDITTLEAANVSVAIAAIVLANDRFRDPDTYSLVIASGIERQNSSVVTIVEVSDQESRESFKKVNIDAFVSRKEIIDDLLDRVPNPKLMRIIAKESQLEQREGPQLNPELI
ncbi:MAG: NAD-binding protein [Candidatus Dojkabacteria bacterium]